GPDRRAVGARTGASRPVLAPGLGPAAGDQTARFGGRRAAPAGGLLGAHALVNQRTREARPEGGLVELDLLRRAGAAEDGGVRHRCAPPRSRPGGPARSPAAGAGSASRPRSRSRGPSASPACYPS